MSVDFSLFGKRYARFMRMVEWVSRFAPEGIQPRLSRIIGRYANPYNLMADDICQTISSTLGLNHNETIAAWSKWRESHALFALTAFQYEKMDARWLHNQVRLETPELLTQIVHTGGLLLTYHTHHQNTLAALLGIAGCTISPVAASASGSPLYGVLGRYIDLINTGSESHFRGGTYLYTDSLRQSMKQVRMRLMRGELILSLCDFHQPSASPPHHLLGRSITPPTGVIRVALQCEVPIYLALLYPDESGQLLLVLQECAACKTPDTILTQYLDFLVKSVSSVPESWQGWEWLGKLVPAVTAVDCRVNGIDSKMGVASYPPQDITALWKASHAHLCPYNEHLPLPSGQLETCPRCGQSRAFYLRAHIRLGSESWQHDASALYCPDCSSYHVFPELKPDMGNSLPVTAVHARLWSASPTFLNIEPTTRCNFRCWYCVGRTMVQADIDKDSFIRMLDHFPAVKTIALVGEGEPLLHAGFFDMVAMARARGIKIMITSNGSQFSGPVIRKLCEAGVSYVSVSIDSIAPDRFADSRPPGDLNAIWRGIAALRDYRDAHGYQYPKLGLKGTLFSHTVDELPLIVDEAKKHGMEIFESFQPLNPMVTYRNAYPADKRFHLAELAEVAAKISTYSIQACSVLESIADFCKREQIEFDKNGLPNGLRPGCDEQWIYSLLSGDVTPCCQVKKVISSQWNIFANDMTSILADAAYENLRFNLWNGVFPLYCEKCHKTAWPLGSVIK